MVTSGAFESLPPTQVTEWTGSLNADIPAIAELGIHDPASYRYISQGEVYTLPEGVTKVASDGFTRCGAVIVRNLQSGTDTFMHYWSERTEYTLHALLEQARKSGEPHKAAFIYGDLTRPVYAEHELASGAYGNAIRVQTVTFDAGNTWWGAVYNRPTGNLTIVRRRPVQTLLKYHLFDSTPLSEA